MNEFINVFMEAGGTAAAGTGAEGTPGMMGLGGTLIYFAIIAVVFYFMLIRPQKKRRQQEETLRKNIEVGDEVITIGGICGRVVSVKEDDIIVIETGADRTKLKMKNWSISSNESAKARQAEEAAKNAGEKKKISLFTKKD